MKHTRIIELYRMKKILLLKWFCPIKCKIQIQLINLKLYLPTIPTHNPQNKLEKPTVNPAPKIMRPIIEIEYIIIKSK